MRQEFFKDIFILRSQDHLELYRRYHFVKAANCLLDSLIPSFSYQIYENRDKPAKMRFGVENPSIVLLLLSAMMFPDLCYNQRIECTWGYQYLCGDKCLSLGSTCGCGSDKLYYNESSYFVCCNNDTCFSDTFNENVVCHVGKKQEWWKTCHGKCKQSSNTGWTNLPCDDQMQCYSTFYVCTGKPWCTE